jgi:5-oxoprolinase (ATP-hydrolysing) subunit A
MKRIDLNCDMGELPQSIADGTQEELMRYISSANIACGGHAGDFETMRATIEQALRHNVAIGAHPGYEDRADFGRNELQLSPDEIAASVHKQILALQEIAAALGARIAHVKPHGALYNQAARNRQIARAIAEGVRRWRSDIVLVGLAGSVMLEEFQGAGFAIAAEAFADRRYEPDGTLRSRKFPDALLADPEKAADQALQIAEKGQVTASDGSSLTLHAQTICIHGDTPGAAQIAVAVHRRLATAGIQIASLLAATASPHDTSQRETNPNAKNCQH